MPGLRKETESRAAEAGGALKAIGSLFKRSKQLQLQRAPSLEDLAASAVDGEEDVVDDDDDDGGGNEADDDDERARVRAHRRRSHSGSLEPRGDSPGALSPGLRRDVDSNSTFDEANASADELRVELRRVRQVQSEAESAWRQENARLRQQLAAASHREVEHNARLRQYAERIELLENLQAFATTEPKAPQAPPTSDGANREPVGASPPSPPVERRSSRRQASSASFSTRAPDQESAAPLTSRERELLRLLIQIVGKDQVRDLLASSAAPTLQGPTHTAASALSPSELLRRRLVVQGRRASAAGETGVRSVAAIQSPSSPRASPRRSSSLGALASSPTGSRALQAARKYEMSAAM
ncbi:hypothetical protein P43SY_006213 [Pythium insidiosum]|uniref:Uncharacterized protein n=1 Tax=Pythium insidiosum TaxID=114742 RepID=A0AAD5LFF0_PYTIN|nr:hypothetical protein P43SY_006213 [Pythium insidiosum]